MGYQEDQSLPSERTPPSSRGSRPPPLPPRSLSNQSAYISPPPSYLQSESTYHSQPPGNSWTEQDPRARSTESLVPRPGRDGRRILLLIWVHGFMGNETSFQSFPAHIHNVVTQTLAGSHVIHTKIYPRYRSRNSIEVARDAFSDWLLPHQSLHTDVILLGHSMGGLLCAEVAILKSPGTDAPLHRIIGTMNFDVPFLGMHPGVIVSGLSSIFNPPPKSPKILSQDSRLRPVSPMGTPQSSIYGPQSDVSSQLSPNAPLPTTDYFPNANASISSVTNQSSSSWSTPVTDPNYNPPFPNDVVLPIRKGWDSALHFITKHSDSLTKATKHYVTSHLEFGGCMADFKGLRARYAKLRALEDINESQQNPNGARRVRFVNFYTASTGKTRSREVSPQGKNRLKLDGSSDDTNEASRQIMSNRDFSAGVISSLDLESESALGPGLGNEDSRRSSGSIPDIGHALLQESEGKFDSENEEWQMALSSQGGSPRSRTPDVVITDAMQHLEPTPATDDEEETAPNVLDGAASSKHSTPIPKSNLSNSFDVLPSPTLTKAPTLPPITPIPTEPAAFDPTLYLEKDTRKLAEKEYARLMKQYRQALKDRDKAIKERKRLVEKREKAAKQVQQKALKAEEKAKAKEEKELVKDLQTERLALEKAETQEQQQQQQPNSSKQSLTSPLTLPRASLAEDRRANDPRSSTSSFGSNTKENNLKPPPVQIAAASPFASGSATPGPNKLIKPRRDRKFCVLPSRDASGVRDPLWVRVFMDNMDEVGAHTGLFFPLLPHYQGLVKLVGERIEEWIQESGHGG